MIKSTQEATKKAVSDWENQRAVYLTNHCLRSDIPSFDEKQIFYPCFFYISDKKDKVFFQTYNKKIKELIQIYGIPEWSPVNLIPDRSDVLQMLDEEEKPVSAFSHQSIREKRLVDHVLDKWKKQPTVWTRNQENNLLIFGGDISSKTGRIDVLDTKNKRWLKTYEFLRKHHPIMPWDKYSR